jgi:hypothetical protein
MSSLQIVTTSRVRGGARAQLGQSGLTARLALDEQTLADAYTIRHASYLSGGFIDPMPGGMFCDADDLKASSTSLVIYKHGRPVASTRMCILDHTPGLVGWDEIPASRIFPEALAKLAAEVPHDRPAKIMESNRLVRHPDYSTDYELVFVLFRFVSFMLVQTNADMLLSCIRRNHTAFYKRMHFEYVDGPRRYAGVKFETNLLACSKARFDRIRSEIPMIGADPQTLESYAALQAGDAVNVFLAE